jgi:hypothetical protein
MKVVKFSDFLTRSIFLFSIRLVYYVHLRLSFPSTESKGKVIFIEENGKVYVQKA